MSVSAAGPGVVRVETRTDSAKSGALSLRGTVAVYAFTGLYAGVFVAAAAIEYLRYLAPRNDLGNMVQVVWSTAHGHLLRMSSPAGVDISRLGVHFDPFLAALAPLWLVWSSPIVLLAAQAIAVASGALPVYWLGRKHLQSDGFAAVFAVGYLLYPATQFNTFTPTGIHAVSFAIPLILYAIWFIDQDRLVPFAIFAVAAATTKEEIAAAVGGLGIWYALRRGRPGVGAMIFVLGLAVSVVNFELVVPHFAGGRLIFAERYAGVGGTPTGILHDAFTDPTALVQQTATWHKLGFLALMFAPFLGLWALEPIMLVGALPDLAINLLSSYDSQTTIFYQYTAGIIPFVVVASLLGAAKLRRGRRHAPAVVLGIVGCTAILSPLLFTASVVRSNSGSTMHAMRRAVGLIPPDAPVSASLSLGGDVSARRVEIDYPAVAGARWVIVGGLTKLDSPQAFHRRLIQLRSSPHWKTVLDQSGITLFARIDEQKQ